LKASADPAFETKSRPIGTRSMNLLENAVVLFNDARTSIQALHRTQPQLAPNPHTLTSMGTRSANAVNPL